MTGGYSRGSPFEGVAAPAPEWEVLPCLRLEGGRLRSECLRFMDLTTDLTGRWPAGSDYLKVRLTADARRAATWWRRRPHHTGIRNWLQSRTGTRMRTARRYFLLSTSSSSSRARLQSRLTRQRRHRRRAKSGSGPSPGVGGLWSVDGRTGRERLQGGAMAPAHEAVSSGDTGRAWRFWGCDHSSRGFAVDCPIRGSGPP